MGWRNDTRVIIRRYPEYAERLRDLRSGSMTANYNGMPGGGNEASRATEDLALQTLPKTEQREYDAVDFAIRSTRANYPRDFQDRMKLVELLYWRKNEKLTLEGVAARIPCSVETAKKWNGAFLQLVDACMMVMSARF